MDEFASAALEGRPESSQLLLFADQFEELFTRVSPQHHLPFVALVDAVAASRRVRLVLTLRADFYEHCTRFENLVNHLRGGSFPLAAPGLRALSAMIERPAVAAGLALEPALVDRIIDDTGIQPGGLALAEFTLELLYDTQSQRRLTLAAYEALRGVAGAVELQGERAVADPHGRVDEPTLGAVFRALAEVDETGNAVRKRARLEQLDPPARRIAERLADARLLVTDRDTEGSSVVEVAHEAVLRYWGRFRAWLDRNRDLLQWRRRFGVLLETNTLLREGPLAEAAQWLRSRPADLTQAEREYVQHSLSAERRRTTLRRGTVATMLVMLAGLTFLTYRETIRLSREADQLSQEVSKKDEVINSTRTDFAALHETLQKLDTRLIEGSQVEAPQRILIKDALQRSFRIETQVATAGVRG